MATTRTFAGNGSEERQDRATAVGHRRAGGVLAGGHRSTGLACQPEKTGRMSRIWSGRLSPGRSGVVGSARQKATVRPMPAKISSSPAVRIAAPTESCLAVCLAVRLWRAVPRFGVPVLARLCGPPGTRTLNQRIKSPLLCLLS